MAVRLLRSRGMQTSTTAKNIVSSCLPTYNYFAHKCTSPQCVIPETIHTYPEGEALSQKSQSTSQNGNFQKDVGGGGEC